MRLAQRHVYFNEYNLRMGRMCYLPIVAGMLRAYAETSDRVRASYRFMPFIYHLDSLPNILAQYVEPPDVAAFSISMWNEQLNLRVAEEVKRRWPECLIVVGGPQVPHDPSEYFARHPFLDVAVRAEGEEPFRAVLERRLSGEDFAGLPNVAWRDPATGETRFNGGEWPFKKGLDDYPSPYLAGLYDELMATQDENLEFQAIIETNRGCPFPCTFCYWGRGGLTRRYRFHDQDRVFAEIEWAGRNGIRYLFNADSNFGMHERDSEIAEFIVRTKQKFGYPEKFRTCYGKNTDEKIFRIGSLFHRHGLEKGITLARQSNDPQVLKNIRRQNIRMETYRNLQMRFNDEEIPIYTELILGLPGETVETWTAGLDELLMAGLKNQLFVYNCQIYPNTELNDPEYRRRFGIDTRHIELAEIHGSVRDAAWVTEFEEMIVGTDSMPHDDWRRMAVFSWLTMVFHSMKIGYFVLIQLLDRYGIRPSELLLHLADERFPADRGAMLRGELAEFRRMLDRMVLEGKGRGTEMPEYGDIYWDVEEASFLRIAEDLDRFYDELQHVVADFLTASGVDFDECELREVVRYQRARIPSCDPPAATTHVFAWNLPEYFESRFTSHPVELRESPRRMISRPVEYAGDRERFARETILWGRKSGTMLVPVEWSAVDSLMDHCLLPHR
ncbi:MAG: cobalamin-dependent protein [Planctomycetaceae bacterium]